MYQRSLLRILCPYHNQGFYLRCNVDALRDIDQFFERHRQVGDAGICALSDSEGEKV